MATYAVGDIQGCFLSLRRLLDEIRFDRRRDTLWCVGDLVNRGAESLATLRFVRDLGERAVCVLGNHDLHLLAIVLGGHPPRPGDTLADVLEAPDCLELADWLRRLPMLVRDRGVVMTHAGIPHIWSTDTAARLAREVEQALRGADHAAWLRGMYGDGEDRWDEGLSGIPRLRAITNYLTRMRFVDPAGRLDFDAKGTLAEAPPGFSPWFSHPTRVRERLVFGHWAALDGETGAGNLIGLDTGCVWGRRLAAMRLEDGRRFEVSCA